MKKADLEDLLSVDEAAKKLGISPSAIYNNRKTLSIPYIRIGRLIRFRPSEIQKFLDKRTIKKSA